MRVLSTASPLDRPSLIVGLAVAVGVATALLAPLPGGQPRILGITLFCIVLWVGNPVRPWFTGLLGIGLIGVAFSPSLALGGFAEPVLWLIVFGLIIGEAIHRNRLGAAIEARLLRWVAADVIPAGGAPRAAGGDAGGVDPRPIYRRLLVGLCLGGLGFALVVPSSLVRVLIMAPILVGIGGIFESEDARLGLLFGPLLSTVYGAVGILTAFLPNVVIAGIVESTAGVSITWSEWFVAMFPVMSAGRVLVVIAVVYLLFRPAPDSGVDLARRGAPGDDVDVRRTALFLAIGVVIWATDFLHGLHPVFGAFAVATLFIAPRVGTVSLDAIEDVDFSIIFFVGAVFAIATGLTRTGFTDRVATALLGAVPGDVSTPVALLAVVGVTLLLVLVMEGLAAASVVTPILVAFAAESGLPVVTVVQFEAIALGSFFFPYQSVVLVAILGYDPVEPRALIRVASAVSIATLLLLVPLQLLYALAL